MQRLSAFCLCALISLASAHADIITAWTFEAPNIPGTITGPHIGGVLPAIGGGEASATHASAATVYSSQVGNGSAHALNATAWSVGDYWQFRTSTVGYGHIQLSWDQASVATSYAPTNFSLLVSTDGQNFTSALSHYQVYRNSLDSTTAGGGGGLWNATTAYASYTRTVDLSAIPSLQNASDVYFRLVSSDLGADYSRIDNFTVSGIAVPEPTTLALLGLGALLGGLRWRSR